MTGRNTDFSKIQPDHFFSTQKEKTKFNWFSFELACELERAVPNDLKKYLKKRGYDQATFNKSCITLAVLLQAVILKKLRNEIPVMQFDPAAIAQAFPNVNNKTINALLHCTGAAWERLLGACVTCPSACISNRDQCCPMFDDASYYE